MSSPATLTSSAAPEKEEHPSFMSWKWWLLLASALALWKYSARDWIVCKVGVVMLGVKWLFVQKVWVWMCATFPSLTGAISSAAKAIVAFFVALFHVLTNG